METSLHRQLKALYCSDLDSIEIGDALPVPARDPGRASAIAASRQELPASRQEVRVGRFRIDAVHRGRMIEIQQASLGALRDKVRTLLESHDVTVVKPLAARKLLVRRARIGGTVIAMRNSPRRETMADLFADLVHFVGVFPHPRLVLEVVLTSQEEHRVTVRRRRRRGKDYRVTDRLLVGIQERMTFRIPSDLARLLPATLDEVFSTDDLARQTPMPRWLAQKMAYCLRKTGAIETVGKRRNAWLYRVVALSAVVARDAGRTRRRAKRAG